MTFLIVRVLGTFFTILVYLIIGRALFSWFVRPGDKFFPYYMLIIKITDPILEPFRRLSQRIVGNSLMDFSPLLAIFFIYFLNRILIKILYMFMG